jgi:hypothetical protein
MDNLPSSQDVQPEKEDKERIQFQWRCQPKLSTPDGVLLNYVKHHPVLTTKNMMLQAARAFWLPLAYQSSGTLSEAELRKLGEDAVYALQTHINYLCQSLGLERLDPVLLAHEQELGEKKPLSLSDRIEADAAGEWETGGL